MKTKHITKKLIPAVGLILLFLNACGPAKRAARPLHDTGSENIYQAIERIQGTQPAFRTAHVGKMQIDLQIGRRKMSVAANCKFIKDSAIVLSVQPFMGIELFRAEFFTDRFYLFDKLNKNYVEERYEYFNDRLGVDINFYNLQDIITNRLFCIGETKAQPENCKLGAADGIFKEIIYESAVMEQATTIADDNTIHKVSLKPKGENMVVNVTYNNFLNTNNVFFPRLISMKTENTKAEYSFVVSIEKVTFDTPVDLSYTDRNKYTRITFGQLLNK